MKDDEFSKKLGAALKTERTSRGIEAIAIAAKLGVNKSTISYYESGRNNISASALKSYCECLGISLSGFFAKYFE